MLVTLGHANVVARKRKGHSMSHPFLAILSLWHICLIMTSTSSPFSGLLTQHYGAALARQYALSDFLGDHTWHLNLDSGLIDFGDERTYPVQVLGTEASTPGTWLWAWANEQSDLSPNLLQAATELRTLGQEHGVRELTEPQLPLTAVDGHQLAAVAVGLCNADAYYRGPYEGGAVYVLLYDTPLAGPLRSPAPRMVTVLTELAATGFSDPRAVIEAYLESEGMGLKSERQAMIGRSPDGRVLRVSFDAQQRVTHVDTTSSPR